MSDPGQDIKKMASTILLLANLMFFTFVGTYVWQREINIREKMYILQNRIELLELQSSKAYPPEPVYENHYEE